MHGGGFYHVKKYKVAPPVLPDHLAWFKWEAYTTWLSGFALMVVLYYFNANAYLIDPVGRRPQLVGGGRDQHRACSSSPGSSTTSSAGSCCRGAGTARSCSGSLLIAADGGRRLGLRRAVPAARRVPPGRRDARHDHGRQRLLQHHPGPLGADQRQEGRPRARSDAGHRRQAALGPQQLLHAAGAVHDDRRALRVRLRRRRSLARAARDHAARRPGRGSSSTCATRAARSGRSRRSAPSASLLLAVGDPPGRRRRAAAPHDGRVRTGGARDRAALRAVPRAGADPARLLEPAGRDRARDARADRGAGERHRERRLDEGDAARQPHRA